MLASNTVDALKNYTFAIFGTPQQFIPLVLLGLWLWQWLVIFLSKRIELSKVVLFHHPYDIRPQPTALKIQAITSKCVRKIVKVVLSWYMIAALLKARITSSENEPPTWLALFVNFSPLGQFAIIMVILMRESPLLRSCLRKALFLGEIESNQLRVDYILISDTLTSYSKPLMDFTLSAIYFLQSPTSKVPSKDAQWPMLSFQVVFLVGIAPYLVRFIQCLREYSREENNWRLRWASLFNSFKYLTYFPILFATALAKMYPAYPVGANIYWFTLFNSSYSFWWDVTMDWKLGFLNFTSEGMQRNELLRSEKLYGDMTYYLIMAFDLFVKFIWLWKLVIKGIFVKPEFDAFFVYSLEILRRWMWAFLKIESEYLMTNVKEYKG